MRTTLVTLIPFVFLLAACGKNDDPPPDPPVVPEVELQLKTASPEGSSAVTTYVYNADKTLKSETYQSPTDFIRHFYTYENGKLVGLYRSNSKEDNVGFICSSFFYEGNRLLKLYIWDNNGPVSKAAEMDSFCYNAKGDIEAIIQHDSEGFKKVTGIDSLFWKDGNLERVESYSEMFTPNQLDKSRTYTFTYDNKKSPLNIQGFNFSEVGLNKFQVSTNNVTSFTINRVHDKPSYSFNKITIAYNEKGYKIKSTSESKNSPTGELEFPRTTLYTYY